LVRRLGALRAETVREVDRALLLSLGLVQLSGSEKPVATKW
jgi:hypothetical protein